MVSAVIVAAGKGVRMNLSVRKQYLALADRPIIGHTLGVFAECRLINRIFLVVPESDFEFCHKEVIAPLELQKNVKLVPGGRVRQESVYNGLAAIDAKEGMVVIHDGVRPFVRQDQLAACINEAGGCGACILGIPVSDTLKRVNAAGFIDDTLDRNSVWLAQTPQAFRYTLIREAHEKARQAGFAGTDDASLVEHLGRDVKVISGSSRNLKITTPEDLVLAKAIIDSEGGRFV